MLTSEVKFLEVKNLRDQISFETEKVNFVNVFENKHGGVSLLAFKAGQSLSEHQAPAEVMINVLEGAVEITVAGEPHTLRAGDFFLMGNAVKHSVKAVEDSKVMLVKVEP